MIEPSPQTAKGILESLDSDELAALADELRQIQGTDAFRLVRSLWEAEWRRLHLQLEMQVTRTEAGWSRLSGEARGLSVAVQMVESVVNAARQAEAQVREEPDG